MEFVLYYYPEDYPKRDSIYLGTMQIDRNNSLDEVTESIM